LPLDAVQEVTVISSTSDADLGQNAGSVMNATIKSGTNTFHGSLYELHRDAALDAANYFENLRGVPKAPFVWNEFGGSAGGPLYIPHLYDGRNRSFLFGAYDGSRLRLGTTLSGSAPTPDQVQTAENFINAQGLPINQLGLNMLGLYSNLGLSGPFRSRQPRATITRQLRDQARSSFLDQGFILHSISVWKRGRRVSRWWSWTWWRLAAGSLVWRNSYTCSEFCHQRSSYF
jgi:hypothetical protein